ncbi:hypothetical protein NDU88_007264 [Pleurodeles waltl]|uniref:Uncharacterized protein n=1 Tax=Pleurodeles waltl TaxID=8319 RepID=A0AAV7LRK6_PLEWA|nr:hypothetical protein NDU88_007264 [Pleurodeles waltl]
MGLICATHFSAWTAPALLDSLTWVRYVSHTSPPGQLLHFWPRSHGFDIRLSNTTAQDAPDWRCPRVTHKGDDGLPRCRDDETGSTLENPEIQVPGGTKREDGLKWGVEEDAEEEDSEENA